MTIALDDEQAKRLQRFAQEHGQTLEQAAQSLLNGALPEAQPNESGQSTAVPYASTLALAGIVDDPSIAPLNAREIDEILADEALNPHNELGEHGGK